MLAAPHSGSGKTLLTCALLRILKRQKINTVSFKCGPDYIDPMFHRQVLGVPSRNLDLFLAGESGVRDCLMRRGARSVSAEDLPAMRAAGREILPPAVSVMEGVMGYFDGIGATGMEASSYDLARVTGTPVILVVDVRGMARSAVPLIEGFAGYGDYHGIRGILLNRVSPMVYPSLREQIEEETGLAVLGGMPVLKEAAWESRHLGLMQPGEISDVLGQIDLAADALSGTLELHRLLQIADEADDSALSLPDDGSAWDIDSVCVRGEYDRKEDETHYDGRNQSDAVRIGIARDAAFTFYYEDNLDLLRRIGAKLIPFSPMKDESLPEVDGLLLGGGYPELHLRELSGNDSMRRSLRQAAEAGMPILAECGGFQYLQQAICSREGERFPMAGVLPGESRMTDRLVRFGYIECESRGTGCSGFLTPGHSVRGHEFHYSDSTENGTAWHARKPSGSREWDCMVCTDTITAGYPHLYYPSDPAFAENFVRVCRRYRLHSRETANNR